jgi:hypothetical protein
MIEPRATDGKTRLLIVNVYRKPVSYVTRADRPKVDAVDAPIVPNPERPPNSAIVPRARRATPAVMASRPTLSSGPANLEAYLNNLVTRFRRQCRVITRKVKRTAVSASTLTARIGPAIVECGKFISCSEEEAPRRRVFGGARRRGPLLVP